MTETLFTGRYATSTLGIDINVPIITSVEAYDQRAGKTGSCLEDANAGLVAWSTLPDIQEKYADALAKLSGVTREVDAEATAKAAARAKDPAKAKSVLEKPKAFKTRVFAQFATDAAVIAEFTKLAQTIADETPADPAPSARQKGVDKGLLAKADSQLALDDAALETKVSKYLAVVDFDLDRGDDGRPTRDSLALLIGKYVDALMA